MAHIKTWECIRVDGDGCDGEHLIAPTHPSILEHMGLLKTPPQLFMGDHKFDVELLKKQLKASMQVMRTADAQMQAEDTQLNSLTDRVDQLTETVMVLLERIEYLESKLDE